MTILMSKYYTLILTIIFIFCVFEKKTEAQEKQESPPSFGLAMHGQTKYTADHTHLDYTNPNAPKGGALKVAAIGTFDTLNPYAIKGQAPENMNLVYDRLMRRVWDEAFTMYPLIAKSYETPEDRSWISFTIDQRAKFHDASPITIDDVHFSFETLKEHGRPNMRRIYKLVKDVHLNKETQTITFKLGEGYDRETVMILAMMPVLSKKWWSGKEFNTTITDTPLLNGPYKIKNSETGRKITYERVENYWAKNLFVNKGQYNFKTITYDYYRDDTIALESFKKGDLNLRREWDINKWQSAYADMNTNMIKREAKHGRPERAHGFIFNLRRPIFSDTNVRKALSLAFDHEWVAQNMFHKEFKRVESFYPNSILDGSQKKPEKSYRKRLVEAKNLLKNAGWEIKDGALIHQETQKPMTFELLVATAQEEKIALSLQKNLQRLGIKMQIRTLDSASFQNRKNAYDYDMIAFYWQNSLSPGTEQTLYWSCAAAKQQAHFNYAGICTPELDSFANQIANAKTYDDLISYAHKIDRTLLSQNIMIPLFYKGTDYIAHHKNITYPENNPTYGAVLESWWMREKTN